MAMTHKGTITLETGRLVLRRFQLSDADDIFRNFAGDRRVADNLSWDVHENADRTRMFTEGWVREYQSDRQSFWAVCLREGGGPIGSINAAVKSERARSFGIGYCLGYDWWNRGIMTEAFGAVIRFLFEQVGANRIEAQHRTTNPRSGRVMEKCALTYEGTLRQALFAKGQFHDLATRSILAREYFASLEPTERATSRFSSQLTPRE
jgi:RimJ/RimL family protein N-acetyltransferase